jgi:hypothetical protein
VKNIKTKVATGATVVFLGGLTGLALSQGGKAPSKTVADKPVVHTKVIRRTIHVTKHAKPKHPVAAAPVEPGSAPVVTGSSGTSETTPVTTGSSGSGAESAPVTTGSSGAGGEAAAPVTTGSSGAGGGESAPVTTGSSGGGAGGGGGESDGGGGGGGGGDD